MIDTKEFYDYLLKKDLSFFVGVPDSLLKNLCACITDNCSKKNNIIAANEGNAIGISSGYYLSTGKPGVVYMQNSGIGNAVNPLLSLASDEVYKIPMLLLIGYRGEPGIKDEPQHKKQGEVTLALLEAMDIKYLVLDTNYKEQIDECYNYMKEYEQPVALVIRKNTFTDYKLSISNSPYELTREEALKTLIDLIGNDFIVSTTGKTSREIFEIREARGEGHGNDFLTVGSMGHTASIAFGMSLNTKKNIYCIDGDGSFIMHTGGFGIIANNADSNFKYILINNGAHESVGGQPTVGFDINVGKILEGFGFKNIYEAKTKEEIKSSFLNLKNEKLACLIIYTKQGSRSDLGRPTITPIENKKMLMMALKGEEK